MAGLSHLSPGVNLLPEHRLEISSTSRQGKQGMAPFTIRSLPVNIDCISDISKVSVFAASLSYAWQRIDFRSVGPTCSSSFAYLLSTCDMEALARHQKPRILGPQCLTIPWHNFMGMHVLWTLFLLSALYIKQRSPSERRWPPSSCSSESQDLTCWLQGKM